jgi:hypothetical protein
MDPKSFAKLTSEDHLTIRKWRLAVVYGAVLLFLFVIVAAGYTKTDTASSRIEHGSSAATLAGRAH